MKNNTVIILILIILLFAGYLYHSKKIDDFKKKTQETELVADTVYTEPVIIYRDSARLIDSGLIAPKIIYIDSSKIEYIVEYDTITLIDTLKVLEDFYSLNYFKDSVFIQDVNIKVLDIIQKNRIFARDYIITNTRNEESFKRNALYAGGIGGGNSNSFLFGPSLHYADKRNNMFGGMYMINSGGNNTFLFSYSKKITFKK